jgi:hypothetical protein
MIKIRFELPFIKYELILALIKPSLSAIEILFPQFTPSSLPFKPDFYRFITFKIITKKHPG